MNLITKEARIETTNHCNAHCVTCPREKMYRPKAIMGVSHFQNLVNQCKDLGITTVSVFGYGEPLTDPHIENRIRYCNMVGLDTFITTNAALLNTDICTRLFRAGLTHLRVSAHGIGNNYESVHKPLKFENFIRNVANAIEINRIKFDGMVKIDVTAIPMHNESVEDFIRFWEHFGIDGIEIWRAHNWAGGRKYRPIKQKLKTCGRPFRGPLQINADGKMMVCCFDTNAELTVGDTYKDTIITILKGKRFNQIRYAHKKGDIKGLICERCDQLNEYDESPLLYSSIDPACEIGKTSSMKERML